MKRRGGVVVRQAHAPIGQTDDLIGCEVAAYLDMDQSESREAVTPWTMYGRLFHTKPQTLLQILNF